MLSNLSKATQLESGQGKLRLVSEPCTLPQENMALSLKRWANIQITVVKGRISKQL